MYNKYFTMKKSQLKEAIKAEIKSVLTEDFNDDNRGLAYIKSDGERDGFESFTQYAGKQNLKNVPDLEAYADGFAKGVMQKGNKLAQLISRATVGGADAEPLMKMIGLKEVYQTNSKMSQIVSLFQDMMDDEYDGMDYRKALNDVLKAIDDDYKAAEKEGEKFSRIREDEMSDDEKKKAAEKDAKKEKIGKQASKLSQADEDRYERIKNGLEKLKKKGDEESIKRMKAILGKEEVKKLIKAKGRKEKSFM